MATLEKIRSKSVLLIVVIGLALLAFIIGDALTNSRNLFGDHTTVAKVGDVKIDYTEYQRKREELNAQLEQGRASNPDQYANFDTQLLAQMAIDQLISEKLMDRSVKELGIRSTGDQLRYYMIENPVNPDVQKIIGQLQQAGVAVGTPAQAYEVIFNPKRNGLTEAQMAPFQSAWIALEEQTKVIVQRAVYQQLLLGSIKANELDKHALHDDYVATAAVNIAFKGIGTPDPKKYAVSDAEIKKAYDAEKQRFAVIEPTKAVSYIAVNIAPSDADIEASRKLAATTAAELRDSAGTLSREARKEGVVLEHRMLRASDIGNAAVRNYVATAPHDSVSILANGLEGFTIVRMGSRTAEPDSIALDIVQVAGSALVDKVLTALNSGLPTDSVTKRFPADSVFAQPGEWIELFNASGRTQALTEAQLDSLRKAPGFVKLVSAPEGAMLAKIAERSTPVEIYTYDEATYTLKPSTATVDAALEKFEKYLANNATAKKFSANATAAGYTVQTADLTQSIPALPRIAGANVYYPESRQVVRWAMIDGEPGAVSHIYECKDATQPMLYAIAIDSEYDDFIPADHKDVKEYLTSKIRADKAASDLLKQYQGKGKTVAEIAAAMQTEPAFVEMFRFAPNGHVRDAVVAGRIMGTKAGSPMQIVKGQDGVYAFEVTSAKAEQFPYNDQQYTQQYFMLVNPQTAEMLRSGKKIRVNAYKFEAGD